MELRHLYFCKSPTHCFSSFSNGLLGEGRGRGNWGVGIDIYTLLYIKEITDEDLLQTSGSSAQYSARWLLTH